MFGSQVWGISSMRPSLAACIASAYLAALSSPIWARVLGRVPYSTGHPSLEQYSMFCSVVPLAASMWVRAGVSFHLGQAAGTGKHYIPLQVQRSCSRGSFFGIYHVLAVQSGQRHVICIFRVVDCEAPSAGGHFVSVRESPR